MKPPAEKCAERSTLTDSEAVELGDRIVALTSERDELLNRQSRLNDRITSTKARLASIEQENQKLKQLQAETEVSLLVVRADHSRLQQENQRLQTQFKAQIEYSDSLEQENQKLRDRLDWIRNHLPAFHSDSTGRIWLAWDSGMQVTGAYDRLDQAIDAALATDTKGGG